VEDGLDGNEDCIFRPTRSLRRIDLVGYRAIFSNWSRTSNGVSVKTMLIRSRICDPRWRQVIASKPANGRAPAERISEFLFEGGEEVLVCRPGEVRQVYFDRAFSDSGNKPLLPSFERFHSPERFGRGKLDPGSSAGQRSFRRFFRFRHNAAPRLLTL